jgi:hypothetical protein
MRHARLDDMIKGWFVGDFEPSILRTDAFEVAIKRYRAGETEAVHHHRVATEVTVIISGEVRMCNRVWGPGDIIALEPQDATSFEATTAAVTVVVKAPSVLGDKYPGRYNDPYVVAGD